MSQWRGAAARLFVAAVLVAGTASALAPMPLSQGGVCESLGTRLELLEDPEGAWTIGEVTSPPLVEQFVPSQRDTLNAGVTDSAWWVRFALRNDLATPQERLLVVGYALTDSLDLYAPDGAGGFRVTRAGDELPFRERAGDYRKPVFHISVAAGATEM